MTDPGEVAAADQYTAATREARAWADADIRAADAFDVTRVDETPPWLAAFLEEHNRALLSDPLCCVHIGQHPRVAHVAMWRPGAICCTPCAAAGILDELATLDQALTCNVCGRPGTVATMTGGRVQGGGPFVIHFGVHRDCPWFPQ